MDVTPDKQNIDKLFSSTTYYIDFYQRQYKWTKEPVNRLLEDIFYRFNEEHKKYKDSDIKLEQLINKYSWYYLNTYVTNEVDGKIYVVDGQQRLTTLTLILIKLYHKTIEYDSKLKGWVNDKIVGRSGYSMDFWMNHETHKKAMEGLLEQKALDEIDTSSGITAVNIVENFKTISQELDEQIKDLKTLDSFIFYFLHRLVLINLNVDQTDVPMVFEVINDRGVRLKPYEILKGKLLGQVTKEELESLELNELWENQVSKINNHKSNEIDQFFIYFLRSKFADTIGAGRKYDSNYHRVIFSENSFNLKRNPRAVKDFLQNEFEYFTNLYDKLLSYSHHYNKNFNTVYFNGLTEMDMQYLLILSACKLNDPQEEEKIKTIAYEVDRLFSLLQLQRSYGSNAFSKATYEISKDIRESNIATVRKVFDEKLFELLSSARGVETDSPISYGFFKETGIELEKRFKRYFFTRIELFIANNTNMELRHNLYDLVKNTGSVNGFHIEHILADNEENLARFNNDDEKFKSERNRLGALLLLKGKDNISSNNETYENKLKTYANTLYWNETLREDSYKSKLDFTDMIKNYGFNFRPMNRFGPDELEERQKLLFQMIKEIWK